MSDDHDCSDDHDHVDHDPSDDVDHIDIYDYDIYDYDLDNHDTEDRYTHNGRCGDHGSNDNCGTRTHDHNN